MRTPEEYTRNLKNHVITMQMLEDCLFSVNKRAKNWRDKEREYRNYRYDYYDNEGKARSKKEGYYHQKDIMLTALTPVCIHEETYTAYGKICIRDYDDDYKYYTEDDFLDMGSYWDEKRKRRVKYGEVYSDYKAYRYYLFYDIGGKHTFHTPISEDDIEKYNLEVKEIGELNTTGFPTLNLMSTQFVSKVVALIESKDYQLVGNVEPPMCAKAV